MSLPVFLLAFANDRRSPGSFLRQLPLEINQLRRTLKACALCEVEILTNATLSDIVEVFQNPKFRGRIAAFHFSGHAGSFELLLEDESGSVETAHGAGFVPLLAQQQGLQLVFLNGCYSMPQVNELSKKGIPAVIGTVQAVRDDVATELSICFYQGMCRGLSLEMAWKEACQQIIIRQGEKDKSSYYAAGLEAASERGALDLGQTLDRFPWDIRFAEGKEEIKNWNLPTAANDPTFGLPPLPDRYVFPDTPFRFLKRFEPEDAAIFFGRALEISALNRQVESRQSSPLLLFYGQSGVGKSSLLNAGLLPRLETGYRIACLRRSQEKGLLGCLLEGLGVLPQENEAPVADPEVAKEKISQSIRQLEEALAQLQGDARQQMERLIGQNHKELDALENRPAPLFDNLPDRWLELENEAPAKPFVLILDQVEEVFTRPNADLPNELEDLLRQVQAIFQDPERRPKGKLILSYRKEYQAEIEQAVRSFGISHEGVFLEKLSQAGIVEVIEGLASTEALRRKYCLSIEPGFALTVAGQLVKDKDSPVAPVLQIVLSKMWQREESKPARTFRLDDFHELLEEGIFLNDFFDRQMLEIKAWERQLQSAVESSGLALDLLHHHTSPLGAAQSRKLEDLRKVYQHQSEVLDDLVHKCEELYLLTDLDGAKTALAHDTLAPIVQQRMRESDKPGQRALRILETKALEFERNEETVIDEEDLALVEQGAGGMRLWLKKEEVLIEKSRKRRAALQAERRRNRQFRYAAVACIALFAVLVTFFWQDARRGREKAAANALFNEGRLTLLDDPTEGLKKIWKACLDDPADTAKLEEAYRAYSQNLTWQILLEKQPGELLHAAFSADGNTFAIASGNDVQLFRTGEQQPFQTIAAAASLVSSLRFSGNDLLFVGSEDRRIYAWRQVSSGQFQAQNISGDSTGAPVRLLAVSADGKQFCAGHDEPFLFWWEKSDQPSRRIELNEQASSLGFSASGDTLGVGLAEGGVWFFDSSGGQISKILSGRKVSALTFSPQGKHMAVGGNAGWLWLIDLKNGGMDSVLAHEKAITSLQFSPGGDLLLTAPEDQTARLWSADSLRMYHTLKGHSATVIQASFIHSIEAILTASQDGSVRRWWFSSPLPFQKMETQGRSKITSLQFSPDGKRLLAASEKEGIATVWQTENWEQKASFTLQEEGITSLAVSPGNLLCATGDEAGSVKIWEIATGQVQATLQASAQEIVALDFSPDGSQLLIAASDTCLLWHWQKNESTGLAHAPAVDWSAAAFSADGKTMLTGSPDSLVCLWSEAGKLMDTFRLPGEISRLIFHPEKNEFVALTFADQAFRCELTGMYEVLPSEASGFDWAAEGGDFYAVISSEKTQVEVRTGEGFMLQLLETQGLQVESVAFQPGGKWVAAGTRDGQILIWRSGKERLERVWRKE